MSEAVAGDAVTVTTDVEVDVGRGDVLCAPENRPEVSDQIAAHLIWMSEEPLLPGRSYLLKAGARTVGAAVSALKHRVDIDTFQPLAARTLTLNDIGLANLSLSEPIAFDRYEDNRATGSFILIDRYSNATVAAGMIQFGLRRATNVHWQALDVNKQVRAEALGQKPVMLWFTGLSGAGKSTIANLVEKKLTLAGRHTYLLDGDNIRHGLNRDLGFTDADRVENIRRVAETARLFVDAGLIVLVSFISPFRSERRMARELVGGRRVPRDPCRCAAGSSRGARRQGPLQEGAGRRAPAFHRHRFALRAAAGARPPSRHDDGERRGTRRPHHCAADRRRLSRQGLGLGHIKGIGFRTEPRHGSLLC